jgi:hypothetical protein
MYTSEDIIKWEPSDMLEVSLREPDDFLKIKETLTRIGISSKREENTLFQSCHILHFKELFLLDGKPSNLLQNDIDRRNTITNLLSDWGLLDIINENKIRGNFAPLKQIKIISHKDKSLWKLESKYSIGNVKK